MQRSNPVHESFTFRGREHERLTAGVVENPSWMSERVHIQRVGSPLRGFLIAGRAIAFGEVCQCDRFTARSLVALGKARIVIIA